MGRQALALVSAGCPTRLMAGRKERGLNYTPRVPMFLPFHLHFLHFTSESDRLKLLLPLRGDGTI